MNTPSVKEQVQPKSRSRRPSRLGRAAGLGMALLLAAGGFLCTAEPDQPANVPLARPIALTDPDSTILNLKEGFRVASPTAYMRSIQDSTATDPIHFTATFEGAEANELQNYPNPGAARIYLNGGWHDDQERTAITSALNTYPTSADTNRFQYAITNRSGDVVTIDYIVGLHLPLGSVDTLRGSAILEFHRNATGEVKISKWIDSPSLASGRPVRSYFGALRLLNIGQ